MNQNTDKGKSGVRKIAIYLILIALVLYVIDGFLSDKNSVDSAGYIMPGTQYRDFTGFDTWKYYLYFFEDRYSDYAWVIKVSFCTIVVSFILWTVAIESLFVYAVRRRKRKHFYSELYEKYHDKLSYIFLSKEVLSLVTVNNVLQLDKSTYSATEYRLWFKLFRALHVEYAGGIYYPNVKMAAEVIGMTQYAVKSMVSDPKKEKIRLLQSLRQLKLPIPAGLLSRLINEKSLRLRKISRLYYCEMTANEPYSVFDDGMFNERFTDWDKMELHEVGMQITEQCKKPPPYISMINNCSDVEVKSFFIREIGFFGNRREIDSVMAFTKSPDLKCKEAAYDCFSICKHAPSEDEIKKQYGSESDGIQRKILMTLLSVKSGKSAEFIKEAYYATGSANTKRTALFCLWHYSEEGKALFYELKKDATTEQEKVMFSHIEDPLINSETYEEE